MPHFDPKNIRTIGIYSSGGDAPGMNSAIRAVTKFAIYNGFEVMGIIGGYSGFLNSHFTPLTLSALGNIVQRGGTVLKTGRCLEFHDKKIRAQAVENLRKAKIDAAICIGGDGSFTGAHALWEEHQFPIVGVPGTIDNDIAFTDSTIGFDTAVNVALEAIDRIRDTADSHDRLFIVEVMGRDSGFIAVDVGLAGGAEEIFFPEHKVTMAQAVEHIKRGMARGKLSSILVTAEGDEPGRAYEIAEAIKKESGFESKVCILGHIQRGGAPTAGDRILACRLGASAVETLMRGECDVMMGVQGQSVVAVPLSQALGQKKQVTTEFIRLAQILSS
jgi:6-phosphofructokinase 1